MLEERYGFSSLTLLSDELVSQGMFRSWIRQGKRWEVDVEIDSNTLGHMF